MACLDVQARLLEVPTAAQILAEDVTAEESERQWQRLVVYARQLSPHDAHCHVPFRLC